MAVTLKTNRRTREALRERAARATRTVVSSGVESYDRARDLSRLIHASPSELADRSPAAARSILARLARALRAERNRGRAGHWTYDLNRHIALRQAYQAEKARLDRDRLPSGRGPAARD
jgi:hypothetical protein